MIEWLSEKNVFLVGIKMPADMVSFVVSTGLGVSVVAGIISGVCYVLTYGSSPKTRNRKQNDHQRCSVCGEFFRSIDYIVSGKSRVTCLECKQKVCQKRCSSLNQSRQGWTCNNCLRPPEPWFRGILQAFKPNRKEHLDDFMDPPDENSTIDAQKSREYVQDFIEKLVNSMLGQNVDDANITKLYNDKNYLPLSGQSSPCTAHEALKRLIEKLLQEAASLPQLQHHHQVRTDGDDRDLNSRTYEDLLATAILNKVISNSQKATSSNASVSSRLSNSSHLKEDKEYFFGEETLNTKWSNQDLETTSISSLEDWLQNDSSFGSRKYVDRVTLTIKQDIEEVSHCSDSDDEQEEKDDDSEYFRTKSSLWSDEEPNWFLQKRSFQGTHSPVPVPMLVPKPTTDAKVLIGDKEIDETSDLSDVESQFGENDIIPTRQNVLLTSKTVIGGKNPLGNSVKDTGESGSESSADSGVKEGQSIYDESEFPEFKEPDLSIDAEQEAEYTEKYASLPRTIEKNPPSEEKDEDEVRLVQMHFSGSYSRREKEKWKNAVDMKNNPYSKENIEKRIQRSNSGVGSLFGSDYYAKLASSPSGTKHKSSEGKTLSWPPESQETVQEETKHVSQTYIKKEEEEGSFTALPVIIEPETMTSLTSDSDASLVNVYNVKNAEISKVNIPKYVKSSNVNVKRFANNNNQTLKRHKSETDLVDDSFYTPPKVLGKKKDNTLISKIYLDPQVRSFALSSRQQLPVDHVVVPTFRTQLSNPEFLIDYEDGLSIKHRKSNIYSSEEDLLSSSSVEIKNGTMTHTKKMSFSSEDDHLSETSLNNNLEQRKRIYSSSEDLLLSLDEQDSSKKKDNTLITKIYQQPSVREYVLGKKNSTPVKEELKVPKKQLDLNGELPKNTKEITEVEIKLNETSLKENGIAENEADPGVEEIAKKKIVHNILGKLSASQTNLKKYESKEELNTDEDITISVKDLRKKFEKIDGKSKVVSSLTARSLSKQLKQSLRH